MHSSAGGPPETLPVFPRHKRYAGFSPHPQANQREGRLVQVTESCSTSYGGSVTGSIQVVSALIFTAI